jgi:capsid protein
MQEIALAGDCLIVLTKNGRIQLVPSERIASSRNPELKKPDEISGVRVNKFGAVTHYRIINYNSSGNLDRDNGTYIPAKDAIFIRNQTRIGQLRGIPLLASAVDALQNIEEVQSAYTQKIKINSLFAVALESNNPYDERWNMHNSGDETRSSFTTLESGQMFVLEPNEKISTIDSTSGSNDIEKFLIYLITFIASPIVGCPEQITGYSNGTFASSRVTKTQANFKFRQYREMLEDQFLKRLFAWFTRKKQLFGDLPEMDFMDYTDACIFNWTYLPVLDKSKDYAVDKMAIENNLASYTEIFAEKGKDFEEEAEQIAKDKLLLERLMEEGRGKEQDIIVENEDKELDK